MPSPWRKIAVAAGAAGLLGAGLAGTAFFSPSNLWARSPASSDDVGLWPRPLLRLVQLQIVHRHGARTPLTRLGADGRGLFAVKWDVCAEKDLQEAVGLRGSLRKIGPESGTPELVGHGEQFAGGGGCTPGQLSVQGARQMVELGKELRQKYGEEGVLGGRLDLDTVYVRSTFRERSVVSALGLISGLYPEEMRGGLKEIPIYIGERDTDILFPNTASCPRLKHLFGKSMEAWLQDQEHKAIVQNAQNALGADADKLEVEDEPYSIVLLRDFFVALEAHDKPLPEGHNSELRAQVDKVATRRIRQVFLSSPDDNLATETLRLSSGPLLTEILEHIKNNRQHKLRIYSAHDSTLMPLLAIMGPAHTSEWPPFASHIIFETYTSAGPSANTYVRVSYNHYPLVVGDCPTDGSPCLLSTFCQALSPYMSEDITRDCREASALAPHSATET